MNRKFAVLLALGTSLAFAASCSDLSTFPVGNISTDSIVHGGHAIDSLEYHGGSRSGHHGWGLDDSTGHHAGDSTEVHGGHDSTEVHGGTGGHGADEVGADSTDIHHSGTDEGAGHDAGSTDSTGTGDDHGGHGGGEGEHHGGHH